MEQKNQPMSNTTPKINFKVDVKAEKRIAAYFLKYRKTNPWKFDKYIKNYPELKCIKEMNDKDAKKFLFSIIGAYYDQSKQQELENIKPKIIQDWNKVAQEFYTRTTELFDRHPWPKGTYTAIISIFGMYRL